MRGIRLYREALTWFVVDIELYFSLGSDMLPSSSVAQLTTFCTSRMPTLEAICQQRKYPVVRRCHLCHPPFDRARTKCLPQLGHFLLLSTEERSLDESESANFRTRTVPALYRIAYTISTPWIETTTRDELGHYCYPRLTTYPHWSQAAMYGFSRRQRRRTLYHREPSSRQARFSSGHFLRPPRKRWKEFRVLGVCFVRASRHFPRYQWQRNDRSRRRYG